MTKRIERIKEGRKARLIAEVNHATQNKPVVFKCVYNLLDHKEQYRMGWESLSELDIQMAIARANGTIKTAPQQVRMNLAKLRENLACQ